MSPAHFSRLLRRASGWLAASMLLLFTLNASAQDGTCKANFTHSGDAANGLSLATSRTIAGLSPHDALTQYKQIAQGQGYVIGRETYGKQGGELIISQAASINARGFDLHVQADESGKVSISTTLPKGMSAPLDAARDDMCQGLDKLQVGGVAAADTGSPSPGFTPTPQQATDICMGNFMPSLESTVEGQSFSTWSLGSNMNIPATLENLKTFTSQVSSMHLATSAVHGTKATLTIVLDNPAVVYDNAFDINGPDTRKIVLRMEMDSSLNAASFTTRLNKEQRSVSQDRLQRLACSLVAMAVNGAELPEDKKSPRLHLRNPFKSLKKEAAEKQAAAQDKQNQTLDLMRQAQTLLYQRAEKAGKAIVFMPMLNTAHKHYQESGAEIMAGGPKHQLYRFDQTANLVWHAANDPNNLLQVGEQSSLYQSGLFGYVQVVRANKTMYGVYIVDPGSYDLVGLTYDLDHSGLPDLSGKRWDAKPKLGMASLVLTRNAEFSSHQEWSDAKYQNVQVYDGSYCTVMQTGGGVSGCVGWQDQYHNETHMTDPGGWKTAVDKNYADGLQIALKLTRPFARFEAKAGDVILTDGFTPNTDSVVIDSDACQQAAGEVIDCGIQQLTLYRITSNKSELALSPESAAKSPTLAGLVSRVEYRPMTVNATAAHEKPNTYEAGWATPYSITTH